MGFLTHLVAFAIGVYVGAYAIQMYDVPRIPSPKEITQRVEDALKPYEKKENKKFPKNILEWVYSGT
ncbi:unnamed protein product, partial [Mesorhabditis spiculigera]